MLIDKDSSIGEFMKQDEEAKIENATETG